jgi:hypothetical protein
MIIAPEAAKDQLLALTHALDLLRTCVVQAIQQPTTFHEFEQAVWNSLLEVGRAATQEFLAGVGTGDLGPELTLPDGSTVRRLPDPHPRDLTCLFGTFTLPRTCYGTREGQKIRFVPVDNRLDLPHNTCSYLLQDINALLSTSDPFGQVAAGLERLLHVRQHVNTLEEQGRHMAERVDPFQAAQPTPAAAEEGTILVQSIDAKGVPMRCPADAPSIKAHEHRRGPKTGRKKQAMVGAVYTVDPLVRTPEQVVDSLFREPKDRPPMPRRPEVCHKRGMARLNEYTDRQGVEHDGLAEVFTWMTAEVDRRNPRRDRTVVTLMDGDERFPKEQQGQAAAARKTAAADPKTAGPKRVKNVPILDLLHVTPKLWKAARLLAGVLARPVDEQVRDWVAEVLHGRVVGVVGEMRMRGSGALTAGPRKELEVVCNYLDKRRKQMRYDKYLTAGYPIASGVIEGACRHYVKDRMEGTGMSWQQRGAQAMLRLRTVALNGAWDEYQGYYRAQESKALYPHRRRLDTVEWPVAA